jgi:uncharacterized protein YhhL (DUF1145 family)
MNRYFLLADIHYQLFLHLHIHTYILLLMEASSVNYSILTKQERLHILLFGSTRMLLVKG